MLNDMYQLLVPRFQGKAIWALLDYIAVTEGIAGDTATTWLPEDMKNHLDVMCGNNPYRHIADDHLGSLLIFQRIKVIGKEFVPILPNTARDHVRSMGKIDPEVAYDVTPFGTGRIAMELAKLGATAIIGIEESLLLYKIALINAHLCEIPAVVYYRHTGRDPNIWNPLSRKKPNTISEEAY